ncbi:MAG: hypothetical protein IT361_15280 [Gemmatimonadaceae bacterium]|nr:hypothetical protein [Gemmatimonadaceae bacterium]
MTDAPSARINWPRLAAEAGAIIFSVLAALAVDEWRESRQDAQRVERAKEEIRAELRANRPRVQRAAVYHDSLIKARNEGRNLFSVGVIQRNVLPRDLSNGRVLLDAVHRALEQRGMSFESRGTIRRVNDTTFFISLGTDRGQARVRPEGLALLLEDGLALRSAFIRNVAWETMQATQATMHMDFELVSQASEVYQLQRGYLSATQVAVNLLYSARLDTGVLYDLLSFEQSLLRAYDRLERRLGDTTASSSGDST